MEGASSRNLGHTLSFISEDIDAGLKSIEFLLLRGPEIKKHVVNAMPKNATRSAVNTVDVFSLLCHVLDLGEGCGSGRDGDLRNLYSILENPPGNSFVATAIHKVKKYFAAKEHIPVAGRRI